MLVQKAPTIQETIHHDWSRKFFTHVPEDPLLDEHIDRDYTWPGTSLDYLSQTPGGLTDSLLVSRDPNGVGRRHRLAVWHGAQRIHEETFYGLFGHRFQKIRTDTFGLILDRAHHFFIVNPRAEPTYVFPLPQFARFGVSTRVLEEVLDAPVVVPTEGLYARNAYVPSLRVYAAYDGSRYGDSTRKIFVDQHGQPVPVEMVAREVLKRLGYEVVPPAVFHRIFFALVGRPPSHFRPETFPGNLASGRVSPLGVAARAEERIANLRDTGIVPGVVRALEALAARPPYSLFSRRDGALPLVSRFLTRKKLEAFLETVGEPRLIHILQGLLRGYQVVSADWFAYMQGAGRVFPCEVKARGDHLRPYQKESILYSQRNGLLDYRLLELLHNVPRQPLNEAAALPA